MRLLCWLAMLELLVVSCAAGCWKEEFKLPKLPYGTDALEPNIDNRTMVLHHGTHHAGYVRNLNAALEDLEDCPTGRSLEGLLQSLGSLDIPKSLRRAIRNNGGGHYNHGMYWRLLSPESSLGDISKALSNAIATEIGSLDDLKEQFLGEAAKVFGSGWGWLCVEFETGNLNITTTGNQDNPLMDEEWVDLRCYPILGVDVWEHAYYLKRQAGRRDYLDAFWNLINWKEVSTNYDAAQSMIG